MSEAATLLGFVGLGSMGLPMARRLLGEGHALAVYDVAAGPVAELAATGAVPCRSAREVADRAATVLCSLPTPAVVEQVVAGPDGLLAGSAVKIIVDLSTTGPAVTARLAGTAAECGVGWVDAPVSGGVPGAAAGTLTMMVSGAPASCAAVMPVLNCLGSRIFAMGDAPGLGQSMKLVNNLLCAVSAVAVFETTVMGAKAGLDPALMIAVLNASSGRSFVTQEKMPQSVLPRTFPPRFATGLLAKDVRLALAMAAETGVALSMGDAVGAALEAALARGEAGADYTTLIQHYEAAAGTVVAARRPGDG